MCWDPTFGVLHTCMLFAFTLLFYLAFLDGPSDQTLIKHNQAVIKLNGQKLIFIKSYGLSK